MIDLKPAIPLVAITMFIILTIIDMLSNTISDPKLEAWAKTEMREIVAGCVLIFAVTALILSGNTLVSALSGQSDVIASAVHSIDTWISGFDNSFEQIIRAAAKIRTSATYAPYIGVSLWYIAVNYSTNPLSGIAMLLAPYNLAAGGLTNVIFISEGLRLFLVYIKIVGPAVIVPLAFCARLIPFTRKLGDTLIALSVALMVLLPVSVIMADGLNSQMGIVGLQNSISHRDIGGLDANPTAMMLMSPLCGFIPLRTILGLNDLFFSVLTCAPAGPFFGVCQPIVQNVVYPIMMMVIQYSMSLLLIVWESVYTVLAPQYASDAFNITYSLLRDVNGLILINYIDFIFIATVTVAGARSISTALGGDWYMSGIQRLI